MESLVRVKTIAYCVTLALAQWGVMGAAQADSAVGQNTTLGNAQEAAPVNPVAKQAEGLDPDGMGAGDRFSHTPSGQMYNIPNNDPEPGDGKATSLHGTVEAGVIGVGGDKNAAGWQTYKDIKSGFGVESFSISGEKPESANYMEAVGGNPGRDDQFYGLQFGKYNEWKVKAFYNETPHVFTTTAKSIWNGVGTNSLTLKNGNPPASGLTFSGLYARTNGAGTVTTPYMVNTAANQYCNGAIGVICATVPLFTVSGPYTGFTPGTLYATAANGGGYNATALGNATTGINAQDTARLQALQNSMGFSTLSLIRKQGGMSLDLTMTDSWKFFTTLTQEKRKGARPIGMTDSGFNDAMETVEPIDYTTSDFKAGLRYRDRLTQFNVVASANLFRNANATMTVANPFVAGLTASGVLEQNGTFSLPPSNQAYGILAELARNFPEFYNARFNGTVSYNTTRQNEALQPWTTTTGMGTPGTPPYDPANPAGLVKPNWGVFNGNFSQWNTSPGTANARIDYKLVDLKLSLQPMTDLSVAGKLRYYDTDNRTNFLNCNPKATYADGTQYSAMGCTGVWGMIQYDNGIALMNNYGATSGLINIPASYVAPGAATRSYFALPTNTGRWIMNAPWDRKETTPGFSADYRLSKFSSLNGSYERETIERRDRERDKTWEDKLKVGYTNRAIEDGTLRLSFEHDRRRGTDYNPSPYVTQVTGTAFVNTATIPVGTPLGGYFVAVGDLRKSDVSDRDQNIFNARVNYALMANLDLGGSFQYKTAHFDAPIGRQKQDQNSLGLDLNYNESSDRVWTAGYSHQDGTWGQGAIQNGRSGTTGTAITLNGVTYLTGAAGTLANLGAPTCPMGGITPWGVITPATATAICDLISNNITWAPVNAESVEAKDTNNTLTLGVKAALGANTLDLSFAHTDAVTKIGYSYLPGNTTTAATNSLNGSGMPDLKYTTNTFGASLRIPIDKQLAVRLSAGLELGHIDDWHYTGLLNPAGNMVTGIQNNPVFIDAGPQNYHVTTIGIMLQYKM